MVPDFLGCNQSLKIAMPLGRAHVWILYVLLTDVPYLFES